jgi:hypothetical protein
MRENNFTDIWFAHWDARRYSLATDSGFDWLAEAKRLMPKKYGKKNIRTRILFSWHLGIPRS